MWTYNQANGELAQDDTVVATGYSGHAEGRNNPAMQDVVAVGPIPIGIYTIGEPCDTETHGPFVLRLTPDPGNDMCGRAGFLMHGDNARHDASQGCIIMPFTVRKRVWASGDHNLQVVNES